MSKIKSLWRSFAESNPTKAQFIVFFLLSNGITVLQLILMPVMRGVFAGTGLEGVDFQVWPVGSQLDGSPYYIFNYAAGSLSEGGGGGLGYFLSVQVTLAIAQVINFFLQRKVTFKSNSNVAKAAFWYIVAYIAITIGAAAAQGIYKVPVYNLFIETFGMGTAGERIADMVTMIINSAISFWVFFPIFKVIFKQEETVEQLN